MRVVRKVEETSLHPVRRGTVRVVRTLVEESPSDGVSRHEESETRQKVHICAYSGEQHTAMSTVPKALVCGVDGEEKRRDKADLRVASRPLAAELESATTASRRRRWITRLPTRLWLSLL